MKKSVLLVFLPLVSFLLFSCISLPKSDGYEIYPDEPADYMVSIDSVSITIDYVEDKELESQAKDMMLTQFAGICEENDGCMPLVLNVTLSQRSFYKNIDQYNSIALSYTLTDSEGNVVVRQGYYKRTGDTVVSSTEQFDLLERMTKKIKDYILKCKKTK